MSKHKRFVYQAVNETSQQSVRGFLKAATTKMRRNLGGIMLDGTHGICMGYRASPMASSFPQALFLLLLLFHCLTEVVFVKDEMIPTQKKNGKRYCALKRN